MEKPILTLPDELTVQPRKLSFDDYPDLMTRSEVQELLRISTQGLYNLIKKGIIRPVKLGGSRRYLKSQIIENLIPEENSRN